jgi:hypothetical protein
MGKEKRGPRKPVQPRESTTELAEGFRKANKALEAVTRDVVALKRRLTKPTAR